MRKKTLTMDCNQCNLMKVDEDSKFICHWGKGEPKIMEPQKGKKPLYCKLKR
jgi:hypothetical protein